MTLGRHSVKHFEHYCRGLTRHRLKMLCICEKPTAAQNTRALSAGVAEQEFEPSRHIFALFWKATSAPQTEANIPSDLRIGCFWAVLTANDGAGRAAGRYVPQYRKSG